MILREIPEAHSHTKLIKIQKVLKIQNNQKDFSKISVFLYLTPSNQHQHHK